MKAIILGNRRGIRHLSSNESYPISLGKVGADKRKVMDWILSALSEFGIKNIIYIGGYHIEKVIRDYPSFNFYYHQNWMDGCDVEALLTAEHELDEESIVFRSDIIFRLGALKALCASKNSGCSIGLTSGQHFRGTEKDGLFTFKNQDEVFFQIPEGSDFPLYFTDMMYFSHEVVSETVALANELIKNQADASLIDLVKRMAERGHLIHVAMVDNDYVVLHGRLSLAQFVFGTKAQTLERLRPIVKNSVILPQIKFKSKDWQQNKNRILKSITEKFGNKRLIVRSSSIYEDSWTSSHAGRFHSELNVNSTDSLEIIAAINKVFKSYKKEGFIDKNNEVLIQPHLSSVKISGVLFTRDLRSGTPYYVVSYDYKSRRTDMVTSGNGIDLKTKIICRNYTASVDVGWCDQLLLAAKEIEELMDYDALDIEFAVDDENTLFLLQIRPLSLEKGDIIITDEDIYAEIESLKEFISDRIKRSPYLFGEKTILGEMPDWNPAEMIGSSPRPLALSLYQALITDSAWADARSQCGYQDVRPEPLLYSLSGKPVIDVRTSFNSFLPKDIHQELAEKIINCSLKYLADNPEYHDKVEFEVICNCYDFNFDRIIKLFRKYGFTDREIQNIKLCYLNLTDRMIRQSRFLISRQLDHFKTLGKRRKILKESNDKNILYWPTYIGGLLKDCIQFGIIPFSVLARYAFVAMSFLKSLQDKDIFSNNDYDEFLGDIPTVATQLSRDLGLYQTNRLSADSFKHRYGHLRPNSYDINSLNYAMMIDKGLFKEKQLSSSFSSERDMEKAKTIWQDKARSIQNLMNEYGFSATQEQLFNFITESIPAREFGKFEFAKNLNLILENIAAFGKNIGLNRDDLSYVSIELILRLATNSPSAVLKSELDRLVNYERKRHQVTRSLKIPSLIFAPEDINCFDLMKSRPNYITSKTVSGPVIELTGNDETKCLDGKIVLIQAADPGYSWIFSESIKGLITQYGGSASHMAISSAELGIPAAIGCGDAIFEAVRNGKYVTLDCLHQTIRINP